MKENKKALSYSEIILSNVRESFFGNRKHENYGAFGLGLVQMPHSFHVHQFAKVS